MAFKGQSGDRLCSKHEEARQLAKQLKCLNLVDHLDACKPSSLRALADLARKWEPNITRQQLDSPITVVCPTEKGATNRNIAVKFANGQAAKYVAFVGEVDPVEKQPYQGKWIYTRDGKTYVKRGIAFSEHQRKYGKLDLPILANYNCATGSFYYGRMTSSNLAEGEGGVYLDVPQRLIYRGPWVNNVRHTERTGTALERGVDGVVYRGGFVNNLRHGKGTLYFPNGDFFQSTWVQGKAAAGTLYRHGGRATGETSSYKAALEWESRGQANPSAAQDTRIDVEEPPVKIAPCVDAHIPDPSGDGASTSYTSASASGAGAGQGEEARVQQEVGKKKRGRPRKVRAEEAGGGSGTSTAQQQQQQATSMPESRRHKRSKGDWGQRQPPQEDEEDDSESEEEEREEEVEEDDGLAREDNGPLRGRAALPARRLLQGARSAAELQSREEEDDGRVEEGGSDSEHEGHEGQLPQLPSGTTSGMHKRAARLRRLEASRHGAGGGQPVDASSSSSAGGARGGQQQGRPSVGHDAQDEQKEEQEPADLPTALAALREARGMMMDLRQELSTVQGQCGKLEGRLQEYQVQLKEARGAASGLAKKLKEAQAEVEDLTAENETLTARIAELKKQVGAGR